MTCRTSLPEVTGSDRSTADLLRLLLDDPQEALQITHLGERTQLHRQLPVAVVGRIHLKSYVLGEDLEVIGRDLARAELLVHCSFVAEEHLEPVAAKELLLS